MRRLIIHAGFTKTGSSSVQRGIGSHLPRLNERGIFMFGKQMQVGRDGVNPGYPLWYLEDAGSNWPEGTTLVDTIIKEFESLDDATLILTSENLEQHRMPRLFVGIDKLIQTKVVFYMRPQMDWIPSAWKQWALKNGVTLEAFVNQCLKRGHPANAKSIDTWAEALPGAKIFVRPFFRDAMNGGNPAADFFSLIGFDDFDPELLRDPANPSLDYSIQHVLMRNAGGIFNGVHDNNLYNAMLRILPRKYLSLNIDLLSENTAKNIEKHFRNENVYIIEKYCEIESSKCFYDSHFLPAPRSKTYMDMDEAEILKRCQDILIECTDMDEAEVLKRCQDIPEERTEPESVAKHLGSMLIEFTRN